MSNLMRIYYNSPISIQHLLTSGSGWLKSRKRYGRAYHQHRSWLREYDSWSHGEKVNHNLTSLQDFLKFVASSSNFYKNMYAGIDVNAIERVRDLEKLPILDKELLRANIDAIYTIPKRDAVIAQTGGTTGKPLKVRYTASDMMRRMAMLDHFKSRHGFENRKMLRATFGGQRIIPPGQSKPVYWRYNRAARQFLYSTFHLNPSTVRHYVNHLNEKKPMALDGFITPLTDLARFIESENLNVSFEPLAIFPTAETVDPHDRGLLERVFNTKVYDQYASSEGAPFVTECSYGSLHIELSTGVFELVPESDEILVTSFTTRGTPLVRYRIGDSMKIDPDRTCPCRLGGPIVEAIYGRAGDYLLRTDGGKVLAVHIASMIKVLPTGVINAQVTQKTLGELLISLQVDEQANRNQMEKELRKGVLNAFGPDTTADIEFVDNIPKAASGKHRLVQNLMK